MSGFTSSKIRSVLKSYVSGPVRDRFSLQQYVADEEANPDFGDSVLNNLANDVTHQKISFSSVKSSFSSFTEAFNGFQKIVDIVKPLNLTTLIRSFIQSRTYSETITYVMAFCELYEIHMTDIVSSLFEMIYNSIHYLKTAIPEVISWFKCSTEVYYDAVEPQSVDIKDGGAYDFIVKFLIEKGFNKDILLSLATPIVTMASVIVAVVGLIYTTANADNCRLFSDKWLSLVSGSFFSILKIPKTLLEMVEFLTKGIYQLFGLTYVPDVPRELQSLVDKIIALELEQLELIEVANKNACLFICDDSLSIKLSDATSSYREITKCITGLPRDVANSVSLLVTRITNNYNVLLKIVYDLRTSLGVKMNPVVVYIAGNPGAGKSIFTTLLKQRIAERIRNLNTCYVRGVEQYWSGYVGQSIVVYDDFHSIKDGTDLCELIGIASNNAYPVPMADLPEKGRLFTSEIVIINSNHLYFSDHACADLRITNPSIMNRRRDILIELEPRREYADLIPVRNGLSTWQFHDRDVNFDAWNLYKKSVIINQYEDVDISVDELIDEIVLLHREKMDNFKQSCINLRASISSTVLTSTISNFVENVSEDDIEPQSNPLRFIKSKQALAFILVGPPGCGKTYLLNNLSVECQRVHLTNINGFKVESPYLFFDDITLSEDYFNSAIPLITSLVDHSLVKKIFITANDVFYTYLNKYNSELADAFTRRLTHIIKFEFKTYLFSKYTAVDVAKCIDSVEYGNCVNIKIGKLAKYKPIDYIRVIGLLNAEYEIELNTVICDIVEVPQEVLYLDNIDIMHLEDINMEQMRDAKVVMWKLATLASYQMKYGTVINYIKQAFSSSQVDSMPLNEVLRVFNNMQIEYEENIEIAVLFKDDSLYISTFEGKLIMCRINPLIKYINISEGIQVYNDGILQNLWAHSSFDSFISKFSSIKRTKEKTTYISPNEFNIPMDALTNIFESLSHKKGLFKFMFALGSIVSLGPTLYGMYKIMSPLFDNKEKIVPETDWADVIDDIDYDLPSMPVYDTLNRNKKIKKYVYDPIIKGWKQQIVYESCDPNQPGDRRFAARGKAKLPKKKLKLSKKIKMETSTDLNSRNIAHKVAANMVRICSHDGIQLNFGLMLGGHVGVTVKHAVISKPDFFVEGCKVNNIVMHDSKDFCMFTIDKKLRKYCDITHYLVDEEVSDDYTNMQAMLFQSIGNSLMWQSIYLQAVKTIKYGKITHNNALPYVNSIKGYDYDSSIQTMKGDCGSPVILISARHQKKLVGIHCAASMTKGYIACVTKMDYNDYVSDVCNVICESLVDDVSVNIDDNDIVPQCKSPIDLHCFKYQQIGYIDPYEYQGLKVVGLALDKNDAPRTDFEDDKTRLVPAPYSKYEPFSEPYQPAVMSKYDKRLDTNSLPKNVTIKELMVQDFVTVEVFEDFCENELNIVSKDISIFLSNLIMKKGFKPQVLTKTQAINGNTKVMTSVPIVFDTSPGYPFDNYAQSKKPFFDYDNIKHTIAKNDLGKLLNGSVDKLINHANKGLRSGVAFKISNKDELRKVANIKNVKTRIIAGAPLDYVIALRMYFYDVCAALTAVHSDSPMKVGINASGIDWNANVMRHLKVSDMGFDADYKKWDTTVPPRLMKLVDEVYCQIYSKTGISKDMEKDNSIRMALGSVMQKPLFVVGSKIIQVNKGMVSGCPDTAMRNCIINFSLFYYIYRSLCIKNNRSELKNFPEFMENVCLSVYGDDNFCTISPKIAKWFNFESYSNECQRYGFNMTTADKSMEIYKVKHITEMEFLKRGICYDRDMSVYKGPLLKTSIDKMMCYTRTDRYSLVDVQLGYKDPPNIDRETLCQTVECILRESVLHGEEYYNEMCDYLMQKIAAIQLTVNFYNYHDLINIVLYDN